MANRRPRARSEQKPPVCPGALGRSDGAAWVRGRGGRVPWAPLRTWGKGSPEGCSLRRFPSALPGSRFSGLARWVQHRPPGAAHGQRGD